MLRDLWGSKMLGKVSNKFLYKEGLKGNIYRRQQERPFNRGTHHRVALAAPNRAAEGKTKRINGIRFSPRPLGKHAISQSLSSESIDCHVSKFEIAMTLLKSSSGLKKIPARERIGRRPLNEELRV